MKILSKSVLALVVSSIVGCSSGLNTMQEREYAAMKHDGVLIEEKNPNVGMALGLLPGGGSFYAREPGYGVINLLMWPLSILWDPISGKDGAKAINYDVTTHQLKLEKEKEMSILDEKLSLNEIDNKTYVLEKRKIENKYSYN